MSESTKRERGDYCLPGQGEKGFHQYPRDMYKKLCRCRGSGGERQIFDVIFRETVDWGDEWHALSLDYFSNATGIRRAKIPGIIRTLEERKMIRHKFEYGEDRRGRYQPLKLYAINPNWEEWLVVPKKELPGHPGSPQKAHSGSPQNGGSGGSFSGPKYRYIRETPNIDMSSVARGLANLLLTQIQKTYASLKGTKNFTRAPRLLSTAGQYGYVSGIERWALAFRHMIDPTYDRDVAPRKVEKVIRWLPSDEYWRAKIRSADQFRRNFDKLYAAMLDASPKGEKNGHGKKPGEELEFEDDEIPD